MPPLIRKVEPGDVIGRCRTIRELGRGSVGTVFLATHQTLQIEVALKVLSPALSMENPGLAERFIREAQLAARIHHPNVISVMDAAHDDATGLDYIVMEYVGGGSLAWHLRNGALPEAKALAIITGIAHALVTAEENRIVHRDIKPDNIILDRRGTAKLADLGLAKHALDSRLSLTIGGSFMGTPAYMSPEQARDAKVADTRDDIYSLGATFYECLTGTPPFQGETPYSIMSELLTKPSPHPRATRPEVTVSADLICRKMMAKARDMRYANAHALLKDLQNAQTYGDAGVDRLEAASLDSAAIDAHRREQLFGVETSVDGAWGGDDLGPAGRTPVPSTAQRRPSSLSRSPRSDYGVFGAAFLLVALVAFVTLLLAWASPYHPTGLLKSELAELSPATPVPVAPIPTTTEAKPKPAHEKERPHSTATHPAPLDEIALRALPVELAAPAAPSNAAPLNTSPIAVPVALPVDPADLTNSPAIIPDTNAPVIPTPTISTLPGDSAFTARDIAERALPPGDIAPTGRAELLRIIGERVPRQPAPTEWRYYFYEKGATGHARIVSVENATATKQGEDLVDFAAPYSEAMVVPEDKLLVDSTQALQIAQRLAPSSPVSSSEMVLLQQRNSVPMWKVTLWTRDGDASERKLGEVTLLAENGTVISSNLKP